MNSVLEQAWRDYRTTKSGELKSKLFNSYLGLVRVVLRRFGNSFTQREGVLEREDLLQAGMIGLLEAIERYDPDRGFKFETYAVSRIHGAMQDELRRIDWLPRSERKRLREAAQGDGENTEQSFRSARFPNASAENIVLTREALDSLHEYAVSNDFQLEDTSPSIAEQLNHEQIRSRVADQIEALPERERLIITLYYYEEMKFKEIGEILGVSESRVSQIHATVLAQIRRSLESERITL